MNKLYIFAISIFAFLFIFYFAFAGLFQEKQIFMFEADNEGMGGGGTSLPDSDMDSVIPKIEMPSLYYSVYSVKKGDIVGQIAAGYGVSQDAIISLNKLRNTRTLQIGQLLKIPSIDGIVYTIKKGDTLENIADVYKISLEKLTLVNNISDSSFVPGSMIFLPDAKLDWVTIQEINGDLFKTPIHGRYRVSSRYGWRSDPFTGNRSFHNGIDLVIHRGAPVYAALNGMVISTGYSTTYGNYVIVRHHSGYQTLYGHLNSILTSHGKYVTPLSKIGTVGSTGRSTGPHLHFTVYKNGATINPVTVLN